MKYLVEIIIAIPVLFVGHAFLRAYVAKVVTGKWPHEDVASKKIFDNLP